MINFTVLAKTRLVHTKTKFKFIATVYRHNIYPSPVYQALIVNWSAFLNGILLTLQSHMARTMGSIEGASWTVGTCICSHWLCGLLVCYWRLCGHHGCSWGVPRVVFATSHPTYPFPSHPTPPHHPSLHSFYYQYWRQKGIAKHTLKFSHQRHRRLAIIKTNR